MSHKQASLPVLYRTNPRIKIKNHQQPENRELNTKRGKINNIPSSTHLKIIGIGGRNVGKSFSYLQSDMNRTTYGNDD